MANRSTTSGLGWFRFASENKKTVAGVAGGVTLLLLVSLVAWMASDFPPNLENLNFQERDWVLIADFENRTGEAVFNGVLEYALRREISNSQFVNVVPRERINDTLKLMRRPVDTPIDSEVAREIGLRDGGIKALLTGQVERLDSTYLLSVELVDPSTAQPIAATSEEAAGQKAGLVSIKGTLQLVEGKPGRKTRPRQAKRREAGEGQHAFPAGTSALHESGRFDQPGTIRPSRRVIEAGG